MTGGKIFLQRYNNEVKQEKPLIISICTPVMSRVHKLRQAGEMAFMDASGSLDRHNPVYFMCTHLASGALPLAVWITSSQSESTLNSCLQNVVSDYQCYRNMHLVERGQHLVLQFFSPMTTVLREMLSVHTGVHPFFFYVYFTSFKLFGDGFWTAPMPLINMIGTT